MNRKVSTEEETAIRQVAARLPSDQQLQLLEDVSKSSARSETPDGSRVRFDIDGYNRPEYRGQHSFGVQGELLDQDGSRLSFDLFADENNRLLELEIVRWDDGPLNPVWSTLKLY